MPRSSWIIILSVVLPTVLSGCFLFSEKIGIPNHEPDASGDSETSSGADGDTDTDTDVNTDTDTDTDTDIDTDTDTDTDADTDMDTCTSEACLAPTDSDTDKDTCTGEACLAPTDSYTDADAGTDTDSDTCTDSDSDITTDSTEGSDSSGTDTYSDTDTGTDTEVDTCATPQTCADLGWECGEGQDACGNDLTCPACETGFRCDAHTCLECNTAEYCGDECVACDGETPVCSEGACVCDDTSCDTGSRCVDGACAPCIQDDACGTDCEACPLVTPVCIGDAPPTATCECTVDPNSCGGFSHCVDGACESCGTTDDACGADCTDCTAIGMQICDTSQDYGTCVECLDDNDCRIGAAPFNSPLGICTSDRTCTCWVDTDPTWQCTETADCPDGYQCARDYDKGVNIHAVCLKACTTEQSADEGLACESRPTDGLYDYVWAPMTTCFAFDKFGKGCETDGGGGADSSKCQISFDLGDGICQQTGPSEFLCTYSCWDGEAGQDTWCPFSSGICGSSTPFIGLCEI